MSADEIEVASKVASAKSLRDGFRQLATEAEIREALEKAFDYRGDITITRKDGSKVEGYLFDRRSGSSLATPSFASFLRTSRPR